MRAFVVTLSAVILVMGLLVTGPTYSAPELVLDSGAQRIVALSPDSLTQRLGEMKRSGVPSTQVIPLAAPLPISNNMRDAFRQLGYDY